MKEFKTAFNYSWITLKKGLCNANTYIFLVIIFLIIQFYCPGIGEYLKANKDQLNLWELYIWLMSDRASQLLYLFGVVGLSCQVVWLDGGMGFYLVRMDRRVWVRAQMLTLFLNVLGINLFLLFCFAVASGGQIGLVGEWSNAAFIGAQSADMSRIGLRSVFHIPYGLLSFNPNMIGLLTFSLAVLLGMVMGLVMFIFMLRHKAAYGGAVIFGVWILDVLAQWGPYFRIFRYVLPIGLARPSNTTLNYGAVTPAYCLVFLLIFMILLVWLSDFVCDRVDFVKMD